MRQQRLVLILAPIAMALLPGCLPGRVSLGSPNQPSPALRWIFDAGSDPCLLLGFYPSVGRIDVLEGAQDGDRVILVCGSGSTEVALPAKVFVLDAESGRILRQIAGPYDNGVWDRTITADRVYFTHWRPCYGSERRGAFNLESGQVEWNFSEPEPKNVIRRPYSTPRLEPVQPAQVIDGKVELEYPLAGNKRLRVTYEKAGLLDWTVFTVVREDNSSMPLCRLANQGSVTPQLLLRDDNRLLLFTWGRYVICVDAAQLKAETATYE
jgi:hypothetical protein